MLRAATTLLLVLGGFHTLTIRAAPGELDPEFGTDGKVTIRFEDGAVFPAAVALQPDGRIIVAGTGGEDRARGKPNPDFGLVRLHSDGTLDDIFGIGGRVLTDFGGHDHANAVAIQPDGKIVAAGVNHPQGFTCSDHCPVPAQFALARYNLDGSLDEAFGTDGKVTTYQFGPERMYRRPLSKSDELISWYGPSASAQKVAILPDGKILAAGGAGSYPTYDDGYALARYTADGVLDPSFGNGGRLTNVGQDDAEDRLVALFVQTDGKITIAAEQWVLVEERGNRWIGNGALSLTRFNPDGTLDLSFGNGGRALANFRPPGDRSDADWWSWPLAATQQSDGKIIFAGEIGILRPKPVLARFNPDGTLDAGFGTGGMMYEPSWGERDKTTRLVVQPDGKIVVGKVMREMRSNTWDKTFWWPTFGFVRYEVDGTLDTTFGTNGRITTRFHDAGEILVDLALQPDGKVLAVGLAFKSVPSSSTKRPERASELALARYLTD